MQRKNPKNPLTFYPNKGIIYIVAGKSAANVRLAQLDRAFGYGPKGRGFESSNARVKCNKYILWKELEYFSSFLLYFYENVLI